MPGSATDPCALYTGDQYWRCRRFHEETGREMRAYRTSQLVGSLLVGVGALAGLGVLTAVVYGVYLDQKGR